MPSLKTVLLLILATVALEAAERPGRKYSTVERLQPERLQKVHEAREYFATLRTNQPSTGIFEDYRAVIHVHAEDSNHTGGKRSEVLEAAKKTGVQVVMFTDHRGPKPETWRGMRDGVLFFAGSEEEGLLRFPQINEKSGAIEKEDLRFLAHIEERYDAVVTNFNGMEIYNRHTDTKDDGDFEKWFLALMKDKEKWAEFAALYKQYPDEVFGAGTDYWPEIFEKWDKETRKKNLTGIGANDAHQNQVFNGLMIDPYEVSFRNLSTHILARELTDPAIRQSLREGHAYVSHDWLADPKGFTFVAANNLGVFNMGDTATMVGGTKLVAQAPLPAKMKLFHNGVLKQEQSGYRLVFETKEPGTYRVEAWLPVDGEERPWIYSNPVYLKNADLTSFELPSFIIPDNIEIKKDISYVESKPEDENKHKLDLYLPKGKKNFPVLLFIHGGAWVSGDRSQYPPLGYRYASAGIGTVVMSYRLAPKNKFPAQIEDAAAAFAWVMKHIEEYGGDTNKVFVGGHSAGGHLTALLALDKSRLEKYGLSPRNIKGAISLSGVFDLTGDFKINVFGDDQESRKSASPLYHINGSAPPFLITYCEWEYFPLAAQAREFHAALQKAGLRSEIVFVPKQNHISEMLVVSREDDVTVKSVLTFINERSRKVARGD